MIAKKLHKVTLKRSIDKSLTGRMGLVWFEQSLRDFGIEQMVSKEYGRKANREIEAVDKIMAGAMSIIAGAERLEDLEILRADEGLGRNVGMERIASADTLREYLKDKKNNHKQVRINEALVVKALRQAEAKELTYDNDAVYIDSEKDCAAVSYKGVRQMSGLLGYVAGLGLAITAEYRRGNESPANGVLEQLRRAIRLAKRARKRIAIFRSDSVAYTNDIIDLCNEKNIRYYISARKDESVQALIESASGEEWQELKTTEETTRPNEYIERTHITHKGRLMRLMILRWRTAARDLFGPEYGYHAIATNDREIGVEEWLHIHNGRMSSENYHKELKYGCNIRYTPSNDFELSRGYFLLNVLAYNMAQILKRYYLGNEARTWTLKTLRYRFIYVCGKIIKTGRKYYCKILNVVDSVYELFENCQARIVSG